MRSLNRTLASLNERVSEIRGEVKQQMKLHDISDRQRKLNRQNSLYLKGESPKSLEELIYRLIVKTEATYNRDGSMQCSVGRRRSLKDVYKCAKAYFKDFTLEEIDEALLKCTKGGKIDRHYCSTTHQQVHVTRTLSLTKDDLKKLIDRKIPLERKEEYV